MEVWKNIKGYSNYKVSNLGRLKSLNYRRTKKENILKLSLMPNGYLIVNLYKNNIKEQFYIHRLVSASFISNIENKKTVNHIDGNKLNNHISNLEWNTHDENMKHANKTGLINHIGFNNSRAKLKSEDVIFIRNSNLKGDDLAKKYNVSGTCISLVKAFKTYNNKTNP